LTGVGEMPLVGEEGAGTGRQLLPKYVRKALISRQTQVYFIILDLTQTFQQAFY